MTGRFGHLSFASEQALGGGRQAVQQDRVRIEVVRTGDGQRVLLAVVADGEGHRRAGEAAEAVIESVFHAVGRSVSRSQVAALREGLEAGGRAVLQRGSEWEGKASVAAAALAICRGRALLALAGHARAYRVRAGRTTPIGPIDSRLLGGPEAGHVWTSERDGLSLDPGDQLILATDGLTQMSPEDNRPYVEPNDLARYVEGNPPMEAARHLISMAMGRDVLDNVTVAVVQAGTGKAPRRWPLAVLGGAALLGILGFAAAILAPRTPATPTPESVADLGYAVLVAGSASSVSADGTSQSVANLGTIPGGQRLIALSNLRLSLQTRSGAGGDISTLSFYLSQGGSLVLSSLDPGGPSSATTVSLQSGDLLMARSGGSRSGWIEAGGYQIGFADTGSGSVGVSFGASGATVDCLVGRCAIGPGAGQVELLAPSELVLDGGSSGGPLTLPTEAIRAWNDLCGGCIPSP